MFGHAYTVSVPDNWIDVDGARLRLVEMEDPGAGRCNTGAFSSRIVSMYAITPPNSRQSSAVYT